MFEIVLLDYLSHELKDMKILQLFEVKFFFHSVINTHKQGMIKKYLEIFENLYGYMFETEQLIEWCCLDKV